MSNIIPMPIGILSYPAIRILPFVNSSPVKVSGHKGDLSRFVEEAVRAHIFDLAASAAKKENASHSQADIENAIDEALTWARQ